MANDKFIMLKSVSLRMLKHRNPEEIKNAILVKISKSCNVVKEEEGVVPAIDEIRWQKVMKLDKVEGFTLIIGRIRRQRNEERLSQNEIRSDSILSVDEIHSYRLLVLVMLIARFQMLPQAWIVRLL